MSELTKKRERLLELIRSYGSCAVAFSAGVDSTVVAQQPKLNPHISGMRENLARVLGLPVERVSVKAKTNERVGPEGREEAISAQAAVLIEGTDG